MPAERFQILICRVMQPLDVRLRWHERPATMFPQVQHDTGGDRGSGNGEQCRPWTLHDWLQRLRQLLGMVGRPVAQNLKRHRKDETQHDDKGPCPAVSPASLLASSAAVSGSHVTKPVVP
jgi:hypothetical protein